jgi:hypothetical protein
VSIGIEIREHGVEECNQWNENEHALQFWDCKWKCLTTRDATDYEFGSAGGGNKSRGRGPQQPGAGGDRAMMLATLMPTPRSLHDL